MMRLLSHPMVTWSARDVLRRPLESLLLAAALLLTIATTALPLLLSQAISKTVAAVLDKSPSLVIRRLSPHGWAPLPAAYAVEVAAGVTGTLNPRPRIWGLASGPAGPLTVVGIDPVFSAVSAWPAGIQMPKPGEAVVGGGLGSKEPGDRLDLRGAGQLSVVILGRFPAQTDLVSHDVVLLHADDARSLLGIAPGFASDLALDVFHAEEAVAILPELAAAFPWPVRITSRGEQLNQASAAAASHAAGALAFLLPALPALSLLVAVAVRERLGRKTEMGLLKALGWTTGDIVRTQLIRAMIIGIPSAVGGAVLAYALVFHSGVRWPGQLLFGWSSDPPQWVFDPSGAVLTLLEVTALVLLPFLAAVLLPSLRCAGEDPQLLLEGRPL
jgi:ABC-type sugar transport system permease subunit